MDKAGISLYFLFFIFLERLKDLTENPKHPLIFFSLSVCYSFVEKVASEKTKIFVHLPTPTTAKEATEGRRNKLALNGFLKV